MTVLARIAAKKGIAWSTTVHRGVYEGDDAVLHAKKRKGENRKGKNVVNTTEKFVQEIIPV